MAAGAPAPAPAWIRDLPLPAAYALTCVPGGALAVLREESEVLQRLGFGLRSDGAARPGARAGRRPMLELHDGPRGFVLRRYVHGGLARRWTGERFADPARPFRELVLSERLRALGLPTPRVVAARAVRAWPAGWRLSLLTRLVPDSEDLGRWLAAVRRGEVSRLALRPAVRAAGALVGELHRAGLLHADLNPNNLLLCGRPDREAPELWVLDLDRSELRPTLGEAERARNLARLLRHVLRRDRRAGRPALALSDYARFLRAYDDDPRTWKPRWRAVARRLAARSPLHRLGRALDRLLGPARDPRGGE